MTVDREHLAEARQGGEEDAGEQEPPLGPPCSAPRVQREDRKRGNAEVGAPIPVVPGKPPRDRSGPSERGQGELGGDDDVQEVRDVLTRRVDRTGRIAGGLVVEVRRGQSRGEQARHAEGRDESDDPASALRDEDDSDHDRRAERECQGERDLGREQDLESEERHEPDDEPARVELPLDVADDDERHERDEKDRGHVEMPRLLTQEIAREAEEVAPGKRGPERLRQPAAEQERRPRRERGHEHRGDVIRDDRPEEKRHRGKEQRETGHRRRPGQVQPSRRPHDVRVEGILAVEDRVRPPREGPDEELRVDVGAEVVRPRREHEAQAEEDERQNEVAAERGQARRRPAPDAGADASDAHAAEASAARREEPVRTSSSGCGRCASVTSRARGRCFASPRTPRGCGRSRRRRT